MKKLLATMALAGFVVTGTVGCGDTTTKKPDTPKTEPGKIPPGAPVPPKAPAK